MLSSGKKGFHARRPTVILALVLLLASSAADAFGQRAIYFVRHAEKEGDDLTTKGKLQAEQLALLLKDSGITSVFTSQFERTKKTAAPLLQQLQAQGVTVRQQTIPLSDGLLHSPEDPELLSDYAKQAAKTIREGGGDEIVLFVGHDVTVPAVIKAFGSRLTIKIEPTEFDRLFLLIPRRSSDPRPPGVIQLLHYAK